MEHKQIIDREKLREGAEILAKYKLARQSLEGRIISDEDFWNSRHKPAKRAISSDMPYPASGWLFSTVLSKHADIIENQPSPICYAREQSDTEYAESLNLIIPVILDRLSFKDVYSDLQYDKLKHGTGVYGVFWDPAAQNGLGDIDIKCIDILNLFWEPGICRLEDSCNVFYISLIDKESLFAEYPHAKEQDAKNISAADYLFDSSIDTSDKCLVIDWYYKKKVGSKTLLHYIKFTGEALLYASENQPECTLGFYEHGKYPFIFDVMYREGKAPHGYGLISLTRGTQEYIDKLDSSIIEHAIMSSKPRYMMKKNVGMNVGDFLDWSNPIIEVEGDLSEERVKAVTLPALDSNVMSVRESKISEMKEISATHNYNYGYTTSSLSSGVAIAALQEAGQKVIRDTIAGSWSAYTNVIRLVIELIRQFYDIERSFRIVRPNSDSCEYISFSGNDIKEKEFKLEDETMYRLPDFDVEVRALKSSAFSRLSQNETILNLLSLGLFSPEKRHEALIVLDALELEGKGRLIESIKSSLLEENAELISHDTRSTDAMLSRLMHSTADVAERMK